MNVTVELENRSYDIAIRSGLLSQLPALLAERGLHARPSLIITDDHVDPLYGSMVEAALREGGADVARAVVPAGESSKSQTSLFHLYEKAMDARLDRNSLIVALGGGVVGDLAGYVAASFMRGLRYVQLPTSLLAMVDSSVGGKTGINLPRGKNLIGAFHQPSLVVCDLDALKTLPRREFRAGLAEVIKYGIIYDADLFNFCEQCISDRLHDDHDALDRLVTRSCQIKAEVVRQDETESGMRAILNFGHTLGHAIEAVAGYGQILHGEAIAVGMVFAARVSVLLEGLSARDATRIEALFQKAGLPVRTAHLSWTDLREAMNADKKSAHGQPRFVLAREIGKVEFNCPVEEKTLREVWEQLV